MKHNLDISCNDSFTGFHFLMFFLKVSMSFTFFMLLGTMSQTFTAIYRKELIPKCSEFTLGLVKSI